MSNKPNAGPATSGFQLDNYILYNINRVSALYTDEMSSALKAHGLSTMEWRILMLLADKSPCSVGDIARRAVAKMPTVTRVLIRMEEDGLIIRTALPGDRRIIEVTMTPKASDMLKTVRSIGQRIFERALEGVDSLEIALVTDVLKRIREKSAAIALRGAGRR